MHALPLSEEEKKFFLEFRMLRWTLRQAGASAIFYSALAVMLVIGTLFWFLEGSPPVRSDVFSPAAASLRPYLSLVIVAATVATVLHAMLKLVIFFRVWHPIRIGEQKYGALQDRIAALANSLPDDFRQSYKHVLMMDIAKDRDDRRWLFLIVCFVVTTLSSSLAIFGDVSPVLLVGSVVFIVGLAMRFYALSARLSALESAIAMLEGQGLSA